MNKLTITIDQKGSAFNCPQTLTLEYRDLCTIAEALDAFTTALRCMGFTYPNHTLTYEAPKE